MDAVERGVEGRKNPTERLTMHFGSITDVAVEGGDLKVGVCLL
jgi:hypothetical protein